MKNLFTLFSAFILSLTISTNTKAQEADFEAPANPDFIKYSQYCPILQIICH